MSSQAIRPGGQALADGVFMRTSRAWAIARVDGTVEIGRLAVSPLNKVPVLRVLFGLISGLRLGLVRGLLRPRPRGAVAAGAAAAPARGRRFNQSNRRFLILLFGAEGVVIGLSALVPASKMNGLGAIVASVVPWIATLVVLRLAAPRALWRYHGAEHKAVAAFEQGVDLKDIASVMGVSRVHNRCGTNLVMLMMVLAAVLLPVPGLLQVPIFLLGLATFAELLGIAARYPRNPLSILLLAPGRFTQRVLTTSEPVEAEQAVACRALRACLAEHADVEAEEAEEAAALAAGRELQTSAA